MALKLGWRCNSDDYGTDQTMQWAFLKGFSTPARVGVFDAAS